ncbi:DNA repair protein RadA [Wenxinia marina]|uniref:DNA repair protein RadA n=1 Tax=Wenxinia marina DSM 24838 TaxID=1123501 RepID=A0A0D0NJX9_9RHOB|nr:DNA repair protein RadA [Wenxinia marina]KIQ68625.1 DNA replication and repair protein RadA [Wenxinia marina DSM 24838]GGL67422.1 DNA repair protein RadA [Wenxinia marina]
MARDALYVCQSCGATHGKWSGRCDACGEWNTIREEAPLAPGPAGKRQARGAALDLTDLGSAEPEPPRTRAGVEELDRVLGGGLVKASALLVGGDPGIGKSTLLLQASARFARQGLKVIYVTGEESVGQVQMRARRLGLEGSPVMLAAETSLGRILATLEAEQPDLAIIDSIQTMWSDSVDAAPGSVSQVRAAAHELTQAAKRRGISVVMVGHVTKEGALAGPRVVEHMVDCVLYFEGDRGGSWRILRAHKNRFGPADEIGVFEMTGKGLIEVRNPSALFLGERGAPVPGAAVFAGIEGTRPILCEIQALVAPAPGGSPRRSVVGWDGSRLAMILAVLEARAGLSFAGTDVYLNVAGGLRVTEPAADLAVAAALVSAREDAALPQECVIFGELALSGGVRDVAQTENRLKEAAKLGFSTAILPARTRRGASHGLALREVRDVPGFVTDTFGDATPGRG